MLCVELCLDPRLGALLYQVFWPRKYDTYTHIVLSFPWVYFQIMGEQDEEEFINVTVSHR